MTETIDPFDFVRHFYQYPNSMDNTLDNKDLDEKIPLEGRHSR